MVQNPAIIDRCCFSLGTRVGNCDSDVELGTSLFVVALTKEKYVCKVKLGAGNCRSQLIFLRMRAGQLTQLRKQSARCSFDAIVCYPHKIGYEASPPASSLGRREGHVRQRDESYVSGKVRGSAHDEVAEIVWLERPRRFDKPLHSRGNAARCRQSIKNEPLSRMSG
jgi:hypothetical protein